MRLHTIFFVSIFLSFVTLDEFAIANFSGMKQSKRSSNPDKNANSYSKRTKVSNKRKFFDNRSNTSTTSENEYIIYNNSSSSSRLHRRMKKQFYAKSIYQNPSNWKLYWERDWELEFSAGLSAVHVIPDGRTVSSYLGRGVLGRFLFLNVKGDRPLSFTVTPCMSILRWSANMVQVNETNFSKIELKKSTSLETFRTQRTITFRIFKSAVAVYMLEIRPLYSDTFVQILITTSDLLDPIIQGIPNDSQDLKRNETSNFNYNFISTSQLFLNPRIHVKRLRGNRIHVRWDTSAVNPKFMEYCIVVNNRRDYSTLCEAQGYKYGIIAPNLLDLPYYTNFYQSSTAPSSSNDIDNLSTTDVFDNDHYANVSWTAATGINNDDDEDLIIGCVNRRTNYILTELQEGRLYYFNVFVRDLRTNLSYPYVRTTLKYKTPKIDPNLLRDSKPRKVTLSETKAVTLKFILKKHCTELTLYLMPCGGGFVFYEIFSGNRTLYQSNAIETLDIVKAAEVQPGKYYVQIQSWRHPTTDETLTNSSSQIVGARMVEIYLSAKNKKFPLPKLPTNKQVSEVLQEKACDSVTVQWSASPDSRDNEYCIFLKREERQRFFKFKVPNQCDVERSLFSDPYVSHSICLQRTPEFSNKTLQQKITGLQSSTTYELQLIVRRHNRKSLSYDLTHVSTLAVCAEK